jgi:hypothetical protein
MTQRIVPLLLVCFTVLALPTVSHAEADLHAPFTHVLTVHQAFLTCARSTAQHRNVSVVGYFRVGPLTDGPPHINGLLFDSNKVRIPSNINWNHWSRILLRLQGLSFIYGVGNRRADQRSVLAAVYIGSHLVVHGTLACSGRLPNLLSDNIRPAAR